MPEPGGPLWLEGWLSSAPASSAPASSGTQRSGREELVAWRRHLHAHPELSRNEHASTAFILQRLTAA
ncbi:MAG: hypothetical protein ABI251_05695, partial [Mycobacteriaceae bacterium]